MRLLFSGKYGGSVCVQTANFLVYILCCSASSSLGVTRVTYIFLTFEESGTDTFDTARLATMGRLSKSESPFAVTSRGYWVTS